MCSEYFGKFLAKKKEKRKKKKPPGVIVQTVRLMHKGYVGNFLMFWPRFVFKNNFG